MALAEVNGATIAYEEKGQGAPSFVFIHGWACDRTFWQPQFDDLSRDHRCLNIDLRGCGESSLTPPYHTTQAADDVAELMNQLNFGPSIIVGHSLGGIVTLLFNDRHPDRVLATVLGDSPINPGVGPRFEGVAKRISEAGTLDPAMAIVNGFYIDATPIEVRTSTREVILGCPPEVAAGMFEHSGPLTGQMDRLVKAIDKKPCMMFWRSAPAGDPEYVRDLTMFIRQEPIAGAGHFFQLERPEVTNALMRAFVDDVRRDPRVSVPDAG